MNAFYEHHQDSIRFHYRCFDRMLLNATIQPFQQPERVMGFFWSYRHSKALTKVQESCAQVDRRGRPDVPLHTIVSARWVAGKLFLSK
jgi:hypothetical protein